MWAELRQMLPGFRGALSEELNQILVLIFDHGLSQREAAEALRMPRRSFRDRYLAAILELRKAYDVATSDLPGKIDGR